MHITISLNAIGLKNLIVRDRSGYKTHGCISEDFYFILYHSVGLIEKLLMSG